MRVLTGPPAGWNLEARPRAVTIGVFDGLHQGHRHVISLLRSRAAGLRGTGVRRGHLRPPPAHRGRPGARPVAC